MSIEDARADFERVMESGDKKELEKFIGQSFDDCDKAVVIFEALYLDDTESEEDDL